MGKKFKTTAEDSSVKLTENDVFSESSSDVQKASPIIPSLSVVDDAPTVSKSSSQSQFDRMFDEFGLWALTLTSSFLVSGLLIPWLFLRDATGSAYPFLVVISGAISCSASVTTICCWFALSRQGITGIMRFIVSLWFPVLLSQLLYGIPTSLMTPAKSFTDYLFYILVCLILPALIGASFALLGIRWRGRYFKIDG